MKNKKNLLLFLLSGLFCLNSQTQAEDNPIQITGLCNGQTITGQAILPFDSQCIFHVEKIDSFITYEWKLAVLRDTNKYEGIKPYIYQSSKEKEFQFKLEDFPDSTKKYHNGWDRTFLPDDSVGHYPSDYYQPAWINAYIEFSGLHKDGTIKTATMNVLLDLLPKPPVIEIINIEEVYWGHKTTFRYSSERADYLSYIVEFQYGSGVIIGLEGKEGTSWGDFGRKDLFYLRGSNQYGMTESKCIHMEDVFANWTKIPLINNKNESIYFNSDNNMLFISENKDSYLSILNLQGIQFLGKKLDKQYEQIDVSHMPKGVYISYIKKNNTILNRIKFIKY